MDPLLAVKLIDLAIMAISAGLKYSEAYAKNEGAFDRLETARTKALLGEITEAELHSVLDEAIPTAQAARKAAKAAVPVPDGYTRGIS